MAGYEQTKPTEFRHVLKKKKKKKNRYLCNTTRGNGARVHNVLSIMRRLFIDYSCVPDHFSIKFFHCSLSIHPIYRLCRTWICWLCCKYSTCTLLYKKSKCNQLILSIHLFNYYQSIYYALKLEPLKTSADFWVRDWVNDQPIAGLTQTYEQTFAFTLTPMDNSE